MCKLKSRTHRLRKKTEIRKFSKAISLKSVTLGIFFCYITTNEYGAVDFMSENARELILELGILNFIKEGYNIVMYGISGTERYIPP